ncbi:MAG: hypothetical protein IKG80_03015, partial [Clostridia bacterium]|nr:hypothetical protein [Clostridia bacterium]
VASSDPVAFSANEWHHWVFQYFKDNCEMRFYFDPPMDGGRVSASAVPVFKKVYRYFDAPGLEKCILILCRMNCQADFDNIEFYNFVDFTKTGAKTQEDTSIAGGGGYTPAPVKKDEIIDVDFTVTKRDDGTFAVGIPNEEKFKAQNVTAVSFTVDITKADGKLLYKAIEDVAAEAVTVTDNNDGTLTIKVNDLKIFAGVDAGKAILNVIFEPANGANLTVDDVKGFVKIKATVTTVSAQTGDNAVIYISAALLVAALLTAGIVVYSKKRRCIDL